MTEPLEMINLARTFASRAHKGQVRKYTGEPYIEHPLEVAKIVRMHNGSKDIARTIPSSA